MPEYHLRKIKFLGMKLLMSSVLLFFNTHAFTQSPELKFTCLTREQGLSSSSVISVLQDSQGYLWFGTQDGLNRYDGYKITVYKKNTTQNHSGLSNNNIVRIFEDHKHRLWIATSYGLNLYDRKQDNFTTFFNIPGVANSLISSNISSIYEDRHNNLWISTLSGLNLYQESDNTFKRFKEYGQDSSKALSINFIYGEVNGNLWLGTSGSGIRRFNIATGKFTGMINDTDQWKALGHTNVSAIIKDKQGIYWIGTNGNGVFLYNPGHHTIKNYLQQQTNKFSLPGNFIKDILCDHKGNIWITVENGGLTLWQPQSQTFLRYNNLLKKSIFIDEKTATTLYEDNQSNLWIGTIKGGIYKYSPNASLFKNFTQGNYPGALSYRDVRVFFEDADHKLWVGTDGGGINIWNTKTNIFKQLRHDPKDPNTITSDAVLDIKQDSNGNIWIGTWGGGLNRYDSKSGAFMHYSQNPKDKNPLISDHVWKILEDSRKKLYIGTYYNGLQIFDRTKNKFTRITTAPDGKTQFLGNNILSICEDSLRNLWVSTLDHGLNCISSDRRSVSHFFSTGDDKNDNTRAIFTDSKKRLWAGRIGLYLYDNRKHRFDLYAPNLSLANEKIQSIIEDDQHYLWIGTNNGLIKFDPEKRSLKRYTKADGLQGLEFSINACFKTHSGDLLFGGSQGFNMFNPDSVRAAHYQYPVYIRNMTLFNKSINYNAADAPTKIAISESAAVTLRANQSDFSFEYAALNFVAPEKTQYAYRLQGFDKNWNYVGSQRQATYTNLDAGDYVFFVKSSQPDGSWKMIPRPLKVTVLPPFWLTWWFKSLTFLILCTTTFLILYYRRKFELRVFNEQKRDEIHQMQLQFFTNISHEFRTPLTLILGTLEQILKKDAGSLFTSQYHTISRNANRLMNLISELMDFRKLESGSMKLKVMSGSFSVFLDEIAKEFYEQARLQNISFMLKTTVRDNEVWFDRQVIEKILLNLVNNSFKYTPANGSITVEILPSIKGYVSRYDLATQLENEYQGHDYVYLSICDNGSGISKESIEHLFERYYRISHRHLGSGIGLAFVKSLILLHKGSIYIYSEFQKGTEIIIAIPISKKDYSENEIWLDSAKESTVQLESIHYKEMLDDGGADHNTMTEHALAETLEKPLILIVDDNDELRAYFRNILEPFYQVIEATNGYSGLIRAQEESPALIISDVMMPVMDGLDFCCRVKDDFETSHIPVILLTARDALESRLEGMGSGADFYFSKPVSTDLLLLTIKNLFKQRQKIKERYLKDYQIEIRDLVHSTKDKNIMDKLLLLIEKKMDDPDLDVDYVCREMGVSKSKLYKKIKDITGQSLVEFIRAVRLKKSMEIMTHEDISIIQVMYRVGILSPSYFTSAFKKEFGLTPSQFQQQLNRKTAKRI